MKRNRREEPPTSAGWGDTRGRVCGGVVAGGQTAVDVLAGGEGEMTTGGMFIEPQLPMTHLEAIAGERISEAGECSELGSGLLSGRSVGGGRRLVRMNRLFQIPSSAGDQLERERERERETHRRTGRSARLRTRRRRLQRGCGYRVQHGGDRGTRRGNGHWAYLNFFIFSCGHMNIRTGFENGAKQSLIAQFTAGSRRNDSGSDCRASVYPPPSHTPCPRRRLLLSNVGQRCRSRDRTPLHLHLVQSLLYAPDGLALDHLLHLLQVQCLVFHERTCQLLDATTSSDGDKSENQQGRGGQKIAYPMEFFLLLLQQVSRPLLARFQYPKKKESADPGSNFPSGPSASLANSRMKCRRRPARGNELHTIGPRSQFPPASCCSYYRLGRCGTLVRLSLNNPKAFERNTVSFSSTSNPR